MTASLIPKTPRPLDVSSLLEIYLRNPGEVSGIGVERGRRPATKGIGKYVSPYGSTRYVAYVQGRPVSALQVVSKDGKHATIANVFTSPEHRRSGWASSLLARARKDFRVVSHAAEASISKDAKAWRRRVG